MVRDHYGRRSLKMVADLEKWSQIWKNGRRSGKMVTDLKKWSQIWKNGHRSGKMVADLEKMVAVFVPINVLTKSQHSF